MRALNFYSSIYQANLVVRSKRCTIRLGDKRQKYSEGDIVMVTYGDRFKPRKRIFNAVIDRVIVKTIGELTQEDLLAENPDMKTPKDALDFLKRIYEVPMDENTLVTVIYFSEVMD
ncbi:MAG TPA: RNA-binding protein [Firmicutes bacterium]|nr:RNA-binding protein [Bacillota bacterium]